MSSGSLLTPRQAAQRIIDAVTPLSAERLPLGDADGRVLTQGITSPIDIPHWDNSAMDGYAVRADDVTIGAELSVAFAVAAGDHVRQTVGRGACARIYTGAPVPPGADTVIRQEDVETLDRDRIRIVDDRDRGRHVRKRGEDVRTGDVIAPAGVELNAATIGLLASAAQVEVTVYRKPIVSLLASGDEIADLDQADAILRGEKVASSNTYTMAALARASGAEVRLLGIARDDPTEVRAHLDRAAGTNLLVTSAGMSVGAHDHLRQILEASGKDMHFWRLRSRPGAPVGFGAWKGVPWIGLPGNPVSTTVTFELFVRPAIRRMQGLKRLFRLARSVSVGEPVQTPGRLQYFVRIRLEEGPNLPTAYSTGPQGSGILSSMARADGLLMVPEDRDGVDVGEVLPALVWSDQQYGEAIPY